MWQNGTTLVEQIFVVGQTKLEQYWNQLLLLQLVIVGAASECRWTYELIILFPFFSHTKDQANSNSSTKEGFLILPVYLIRLDATWAVSTSSSSFSYFSLWRCGHTRDKSGRIKLSLSWLQVDRRLDQVWNSFAIESSNNKLLFIRINHLSSYIEFSSKAFQRWTLWCVDMLCSGIWFYSKKFQCYWCSSFNATSKWKFNHQLVNISILSKRMMMMMLIIWIDAFGGGDFEKSESCNELFQSERFLSRDWNLGHEFASELLHCLVGLMLIPQKSTFRGSDRWKNWARI